METLADVLGTPITPGCTVVYAANQGRSETLRVGTVVATWPRLLICSTARQRAADCFALLPWTVCLRSPLRVVVVQGQTADVFQRFRHYRIDASVSTEPGVAPWARFTGRNISVVVEPDGSGQPAVTVVEHAPQPRVLMCLQVADVAVRVLTPDGQILAGMFRSAPRNDLEKWYRRQQTETEE